MGDQFETVGIMCGCGFEHGGPPDTWPAVFFPEPDIEAMIATRDRMSRKPTP